MKKINLSTIQIKKDKQNLWFGEIEIKDDAGKTSLLSIDLDELLPFLNCVSKDVYDFFIISASVYGIDRFIERKSNSVDGWSREIIVSFPVHNLTLWNSCKEDLEKLLSFLTGDYWSISFKQENSTLPTTSLKSNYTGVFEQVNLFSGGLDSLIGAIDFLKKDTDTRVLFVSHYDPQMKGVRKDQHNLIPELEKKFTSKFESIPSIKVSLEKVTEMTFEKTFRSRSILFIGLALTAAISTKTNKIIIPENGTVSLNYPLSSSRRSSCSTRTTHPLVIVIVQSIWEKLGINVSIINPYEYHTKGEMVERCMKEYPFLSELIEKSNSCGKRGHVRTWKNKSAKHCGVCMPCIYRQAALVKFQDKTTYSDELNDMFPLKEKNEKSQDSGAMLNFLAKRITKQEIKQELIVNGVRDLSKIKNYVDVVWRTREELKNWVRKVGNNYVKNKANV